MLSESSAGRSVFHWQNAQLDEADLSAALSGATVPQNDGTSKFVVQARDEIFADVMRVSGLTEPLEIPSLFLQPEKGVNRTAWQLQPYRTYMKNLQIQKIPGNHWPFLVEPAPFNQAVAAFLENC